MTPAHRGAELAELVCSNSLRSDSTDTAAGLLKAEMRLLGSLVLEAAAATRVPAGGALAVDRTLFAREVTRRIGEVPAIELRREQATELAGAGVRVLATGPLTSEPLARSLAAFTGREHLNFYDAVAPIVEAGSIDLTRVFRASRYGKGEEGAYLNCPMSREEYERFYEALTAADLVRTRPFEEERYFERCLPIEVMAARGKDTLRFGPLKPVGLCDPSTGRRPYAVVQLRQDNLAAEHFNLVGFQTRMKMPEQERVFRLIPGLENARFARLGQIHRNTFISAPDVLLPTLQTKKEPALLIAGQLSGVEGYIESASSGILAGINAARLGLGLEPVIPPEDTILGALCRYIALASPKDFQPMKACFGILPPLAQDARGRKQRRLAYSERALESMKEWIGTL
jgi:methylenetetrahydrofolate--tRNA-(uracil-5-)-methyltransferase